MQNEEIKGDWKIITINLEDEGEYSEWTDEKGVKRKVCIRREVERTEYLIVYIPKNKIVKSFYGGYCLTSVNEYQNGSSHVYFSDDGLSIINSGWDNYKLDDFLDNN
ncbi:hypothetical protein Fleli_2772 [Bernardetia litoralis DSM 6794]|uniref:Uncharacterized protein n=1 Tax=Bernardetia litoralis (strain ATCC 23117 / DSM 6794 / NBRC 15988 / NCIMB 1366 / Fx l1 / Sio-4) TaxID=880071 RepID=I4AME0_BERLS|nr:hypothetical protein [Bernardetia litoralis]AFM05125.1 hypothetical protein Fleli_2772 [Bernardetia litoralis DSM 6794]